MQKIFLLLCVLILAGCASKIQWGTAGVMNASDYTIRETLDTQTGKILTREYVPSVPDRWYTDGLEQITENLGPISSLIEKILAYLKVQPATPTPAPAPTPTPTPTPTPAPTPTPTPTPAPGPTPPLVESSVFSREGNTITLDLGTLPGSMRAQGFQGSDNALWYFMATVYAWGPGVSLPQVADLAQLQDQKQRAAGWFDGEVLKVRDQMDAHLAYQVVATSNDARDRLGFRLGPAIVDRLKEFGARVQLGNVVPESEY